MLVRRRIRQIHRLLGLLVFIQLLFWVGGGLTMAYLNLDEVRGAHRSASPDPVDLRQTEPLYPIASVLAVIEQSVHAVQLGSVAGQPVYRLKLEDGWRLIDAVSGQRLSPIDGDRALAVARADYTGDLLDAKPVWVSETHYEVRGRDLPLWRIDTGDDLDTRLYISPDSGEVVARRNRLWRIFDFVWMLHIMDYDQRSNFNHPLLIGFAFTTLLFVFSGLWMLVLAYRR